MSRSTTLAQSIATHFTFNNVLRRLVTSMPKLDLEARKAILGICQTRVDTNERPSLLFELEIINASLSKYDDGILYSDQDLEALSETVASTPVFRAFTSMLVRNEACDHKSGASEAIVKGFLKELRASQKEQTREAPLDFTCLDPDNFHPTDYSIYYPISPWWTRHARQFTQRLLWQLKKIGVLFPRVQRNKNLSRDTCQRLVESGANFREPTDYRSVDLEVWKMKTGIAIEGDCEMRLAWKFNELKPRLYYCMGGSSYWRSRHMKKIAIAFMECIDATKLHVRMDPTVLQYSILSDDWLAIWDMASFTTSLDQLKHFMYYVAKVLEDDLRAQQNPIKIFDYEKGIIEITIDRLLLEYNEENLYQPFSIWRVADKIFDTFHEVDDRFYQQSSGMLGVNGNIGFSCCFHGFHLEAGVKRGCGCSVGDDAFGAIGEDPRDRLIPHMRLIGDLAEEKVDILPPLEDEYEQVAKFLKRRLTRDQHGITLDFMYTFPGLAVVFGVSDDYHTIREKERADIIMKFAGQVGAFFWQLYSIGYMDEQDRELIDRILSLAYRKLDLDTRGMLPGRKHACFGEGIPMSVPPLKFDYCREDWAEFLWDNTSERFALLPVESGPVASPSFLPFAEFTCTESPFLNALEDVGAVTKIRAMKELVRVDDTNRRRFRVFLEGRSSKLWFCRFTDFRPLWYNDFRVSDISMSSVYDVRNELY